MKPLSSSRPVVVLSVSLAFSVGAAAPAFAAMDNPKVELVGAYRYLYHDPMSLTDATALACQEAAKLAVSSSRLFIDSTSGVMESQVVRDLVQRISSGYLKEIQVLEQTEKGRTVYCKVRAFINPDEVRAVIQTEVNRSLDAETGVDANRALKILSVRDTQEGRAVEVVFKALRRLDWRNTAYEGSLRESADLMIDYYDEKGAPIAGDRYSARKASQGDTMNPGQIGVHKFVKPTNAKSYRVWLVK
jgi:hypothetical protein